jgi:peptidoglycan/xylan/chitin deacetylase (PgdA/CDA1 family)
MSRPETLQGVFTLSLDCEGLWGMADQKAALQARQINNVTLTDAYEFIYSTLDRAGLKATAAFVTCFASEPDAVLNQIQAIEQLAFYSPEWFVNVLGELKAGHLDGWNGSSHFRLLKQAGHEMAWHGATHMPLNEQTSLLAVDLEVQLAKKLFANLGYDPTTIVFPRNLIGHLGRLRSAGFNTYRSSPPGGFIGRVGSLLSEWNVRDTRVSGKPVLLNEWHVSPAGFFFNWPSGLRRLVPIDVTVQRWKSLLRSAALQGGYVHMWFHPHNLITAPAMKMAFAEVIREVGELVLSRDLVNLTIEQANTHFAFQGSQ